MRAAAGASVFLVCLFFVAGVGSSAFAKQQGKECQILDQTPEAVYEFDVAYVSLSDIKDIGKTDILEVNADWAFYYCRTTRAI